MLPGKLKAQAWMTGYSYRKKLTIDKSKVSTRISTPDKPPLNNDQIDFPVYIEITDRDLVFKNGSCGSRIQDFEGRDISFALSSTPTIPLKFQIDEYDPITGTLKCWVKISSLSARLTPSAATEIYLYYGGSILHNSQSAIALQTWNSDFSKVWHMNSMTDQSGIHQMSKPAAAAAPLFLPGKLSNSAAFNGQTSMYYGPAETNVSVTISAWIKFNTLGTEQMIVTNDSIGIGGFQFKVNAAGNLVVQIFAGLAQPTISTGVYAMQETGRWYHVWATIAPGVVELWLDNGINRTNSHTLIKPGPGGRIQIGASKQNDKHFNGQIDELVIYKRVIPRDWMSTSYVNQTDPRSFFSIGAEEFNTTGFIRFTGNNTQWNVPSNWTGNAVPLANANILIPAGKRVISTTNTIFNRLIVEAGGTLEVGSELSFDCLVNVANNALLKVNDGGTLRFGNYVRNDGQIISNGLNAKVIFQGTGLDQEYSGLGAASLSSVENNQSNVQSKLQLSASIEVNKSVNLRRGVLQSDQTLIMKAISQTATASVMPVDPLVASVAGNVVVEQYISGEYPSPATARGWRLLSSPVFTSSANEIKSYNSNSYKEGIFVTGAGGSVNGFDASPLNGATIYTHDQSLPGSLSQKYLGIKRIDQKIEFGKGVYIFSRGGRYTANAFSNQIQTQPFINPKPYILKHIGQLYIGELSLALSNNDSQLAGDGFNLIGNPYASSVRWGDISSENTTGFIWQFDPLNGAYVVDNSPNIIIPSATAFFVRVAAGKKTGTITFNEQSKYALGPATLPFLQTLKRENNTAAVELLTLKVTLSNDYFSQPFTLKLVENGTNGINDQDALKIGEGYVSISSIVDGEYLSYDNRAKSAEPITVKLNIVSASTGSHQLTFHRSFADQNLQIFLRDDFLNTQEEITKNSQQYHFSIHKQTPAGSGKERFKLVIQMKEEPIVLRRALKIYPNPFNDHINLELADENKENTNLMITDVLGSVLKKMQISVGNSSIKIDTQTFSKGIYFLQLINEKTKRIISTLKIIKL